MLNPCNHNTLLGFGIFKHSKEYTRCADCDKWVDVFGHGFTETEILETK